MELRTIEHAETHIVSIYFSVSELIILATF
jgi:hypothetical protein